MNERIEAFIDQMSRTGLPYQAGDRELTVTGSDLEYFAELIVRDVVEQIITRERTDGEWYQYDIFKHFGVEE